MCDEDDVDQVKEEDDGVVALGGGQTRIYMGDVDGVGQVKKEGKGVKLGGGRTRVNIKGVWWFCPQNHRAVLVVSSSKPSEGFGGFVLKTIGAVFGGLSSKPSDAGLRVWALKPGRRFRCGTDGTWRHRGVRVEAKLPVRRRGGRRMKKEKVGRIYIWRVFGLCASCKGVFVF